MKMMTAMMRGCDVARFGSLCARHAHKAAIASARAKREHAGVRVRETTGNCLLPWPLPLPLPCRRRRRGINAKPPRLPRPAAAPDADRGGASSRAARRRRARCNGNSVDTVHGAYLSSCPGSFQNDLGHSGMT